MMAIFRLGSLCLCRQRLPKPRLPLPPHIAVKDRRMLFLHQKAQASLLQQGTYLTLKRRALKRLRRRLRLLLLLRSWATPGTGWRNRCANKAR